MTCRAAANRGKQQLVFLLQGPSPERTVLQRPPPSDNPGVSLNSSPALKSEGLHSNGAPSHKAMDSAPVPKPPTAHSAPEAGLEGQLSYKYPSWSVQPTLPSPHPELRTTKTLSSVTHAGPCVSPEDSSSHGFCHLSDSTAGFTWSLRKGLRVLWWGSPDRKRVSRGSSQSAPHEGGSCAHTDEQPQALAATSTPVWI